MGIITLLTDFGLKDPYVGIMKGVILSLNRKAAIVDLTHHVGHGDVARAARIIRESVPYFPPGAIHVAVVDPGVGTERRPILVKSRNQFFVGPDNGLFWPVITTDPKVLMIHLTHKDFFLPRISNTFHGRDIFAPVAGHLSLGMDPLKMGEVMEDPVSLPDTAPLRKKDSLVGKVVGIDHFGNVITNIHHDEWVRFLGNRQMMIRVSGKKIRRIAKTYADGEEGELLALFGSNGYLEFAVNSGRADRLLNLDEARSLPSVMVDRVAT